MAERIIGLPARLARLRAAAPAFTTQVLSGHPGHTISDLCLQLAIVALCPGMGACHRQHHWRRTGLSGMELAQSGRSEEHTSELQSLMRISYGVFFLKKKTTPKTA